MSEETHEQFYIQNRVKILREVKYYKDDLMPPPKVDPGQMKLDIELDEDDAS